MIQLDTSFLIRALVRDTPQSERLHDWIDHRTTLAISSIGWTEFLCGPVAPMHVELATRIVGKRVPYGAAEAELAARLFNDSGRRRGSLMDCMIAATAIRAGAQLATSNATDFRVFTGLVLA